MRMTGLVRVTVAAPNRRIDVALPEYSAVAETVPGLLRIAGEHLADDGVEAGGWALRRADGSALDLGLTLGQQRIRDGEVLHLVESSVDWPELEYDDVVDAIAGGAGRTGRMWAARTTRHTGLVLCGLALLLVLIDGLRATPPAVSSGWFLGVAILLLAAGTVFSRAIGDASAGSVLGAISLPFAISGTGLLLAGDGPLTSVGTPELLSASAGLLLAGLLALVGTADRPALFIGAIVSGLLGLVGGWLATWESLDPYEAAALLAGALLAFSPMFGVLSIRLGRVPMPVLPRTTTDLVSDASQPPRRLVYLAVIRADAFLTGLLIATATAGIVCLSVLVNSGSRAAIWYVGLLSLGFLLRARLYPAVRHRLTLLAAGFGGLVALAVGPLSTIAVSGLVLLVAAALVLAIGLLASTRPLSPYLGRYGELLELGVVLAIIPVCCAVLDLYSVVRGIGG
ncbi:type VII secretion integral membrane protein EccD [Kribbella sp. VKM Ac-2527]|uniref:Type VII secretion integral membrane protein EccD n=1 Tax=Kribbella caucasensis TaxID=2512215 RepID=A0A4R6KHZ1_9ACTN|nr:type VII secretion integral membrane protein EccD [Kribbella sp. VKM Ac-2527]TDO50634.1 type VII secretion integral membrane protein EccD [Kribbella sp. VKM Ac-2527]